MGDRITALLHAARCSCYKSDVLFVRCDIYRGFHGVLWISPSAADHVQMWRVIRFEFFRETSRATAAQRSAVRCGAERSLAEGCRHSRRRLLPRVFLPWHFYLCWSCWRSYGDFASNVFPNQYSWEGLCLLLWIEPDSSSSGKRYPIKGASRNLLITLIWLLFNYNFVFSTSCQLMDYCSSSLSLLPIARHQWSMNLIYF